MKLTNAQRALLHDVANGRTSVVQEYKPGQKLVELGLCTPHHGRLGGYWLELTDAGRAALREEKGE